MEKTNQPQQRRDLLAQAESGLRTMKYLLKRHQVYNAHLERHFLPVADCPTCDAVLMLCHYLDCTAGGLAARAGSVLPPLRVILLECRASAWRLFGDDSDRAMKVEGAWLELAAIEMHRNGRAKKIFDAHRGG